MSFAKSFLIKILVICGLFLGLSFLPEKTDLLSSWLYTLAATTSFLIIGNLFLERMEPKNLEKFFNLSSWLAFALFLVFLLSWTDIFTGPYKDACRWPMLVSALIIILAVFLGWIGLAAYEHDQREEEGEDYYYYSRHEMATPQNLTETPPKISEEDKMIQQFHCQLTTPGLWPLE